jgi:hypothetical protein
MSIVHFERLTGDIDGVNRDFYTSNPYYPDRLVVFSDGAFTDIDLDDGWEETDYLTGHIRMKEAPQSGDVLWAWYHDTSPPLPETEVTNLTAEVDTVDEIVVVSNPYEIASTVIMSNEMSAEIGFDELEVSVDTAEIAVQIEVCET